MADRKSAREPEGLSDTPVPWMTDSLLIGNGRAGHCVSPVVKSLIFLEDFKLRGKKSLIFLAEIHSAT